MNPSQLLITLSSLTQHLITDLLTSPKLSDPTGSLRHSLASRNAFLDITFDAAYVRDRYKMAPKEDRELTAVTSGWSAVGDLGDIATWVVE